MKGIILAGGSGTRLNPLTKAVSKQLLPVYDKPMIYYPLSVLMHAGIKDILVICTPEELLKFKKLLGDGSEIGMNFTYEVQPSPDGLAQAFIIGKDFIGSENVCLVLGDNIFYSPSINEMLSNAISNLLENSFATVFGYKVPNPERYGVVNFDKFGKPINIEEKPKKPKSDYAVTGIYFYPNDVVKKALKIEPSDRGELEITSITELYLQENRLDVQIMSDESTWMDAGTFESLFEATKFIKDFEMLSEDKLACIEQIAFSKGYIDKEQLIYLAKKLGNNTYGQYLLNYIKRI